MKKILILLGPPGAGKGTVGGRLSEIYNLPLISSGDLLRENVNNHTELGEKANSYIKKGELVPDELVEEIIEDRIKREDCNYGFILDGFPRTLKQAEDLEKILQDKGVPIVIYLSASDDFLIERLSNRRICENCGAIYHLINLPPKEEGICDKCGGKLIQREDDKPEVIKRRLEVYHKLTQPIIDYYRKKGNFFKISGEGNLEETITRIKEILKW